MYANFETPLNTSNDTGLNAIFASNNVSFYVNNNTHPYPPYQYRTHIILGTNTAHLLNDLLAYNTVIESAKITTGYEFTDAIRLQLVNLNIGIPTGVANSIITTNDSNLNTIFQNFNVFFYSQSYPSALSNNLLRYYDVVCNCDKNLLKNALLNYTSVIQTTENIEGGLVLSNTNFKEKSVAIYPNPFSNNFNIETENIVSNYSLFDFSGKQIVETNSKTELDLKTPQLNAGFYILNLTFENGDSVNYKLIKK